MVWKKEATDILEIVSKGRPRRLEPRRPHLAGRTSPAAPDLWNGL